jgi:O-antigen/teichoic acid export membrane protein
VSKKRLRENSFVEGSLIAYLAIIFTKVMGLLYNIPFYQMIGDEGGFIYSCAYSIYVLFLSVSTSGIPVAISILIGEYNALGKFKSTQRAYRLGRRYVALVSFISFVLIQIFAPALSRFFISGSETGAQLGDLTIAFRVISLCLLIVPFLSVERGYFQGHKFIGVSSVSQIIEQAVRIAFVLFGAYVTLYVLRQSQVSAVYVALFGAAFAALVAWLYVLIKKRSNKDTFHRLSHENINDIDLSDVSLPPVERHPDSASVIAKKLIRYCSTVVIYTISIHIYTVVDMKLLLYGLDKIGYSVVETQTVVGIVSNWAPKIAMITAALPIGMANSIAPHIANSYAKRDLLDVNVKLNQAIGVIFCINLPMTIGLSLFSPTVYNIFYGSSPHGPSVLVMTLLLTMVNSFVNVFSMAAQSMGKGKLVITSTLTGIVINAVCDLPLIFLFHRLGLRPYTGASASSILGQLIVLGILTRALHREVRFSAKPSLQMAKKMSLPIGAMTAGLFLLRWLWPTDGHGRLFQTLQMIIFALAGVVVYLPLAGRTGVIDPLLTHPVAKRLLTYKPIALLLGRRFRSNPIVEKAPQENETTD